MLISLLLAIKSQIRNLSILTDYDYRLKQGKVYVDLDTMEVEQLVGIYKFLERYRQVKSVALWSCFFNYNGEYLQSFIN